MAKLPLPEVAPRERRGGRKVDGKHPLFLSLPGVFRIPRQKETDYISARETSSNLEVR